MNTLTIALTTNPSDLYNIVSNVRVVYPEYTLKGATEVTYDISGAIPVNQAVFGYADPYTAPCLTNFTFDWGDQLVSLSSVDFIESFSCPLKYSLYDTWTRFVIYGPSSSTFKHNYIPPTDLTTYFFYITTIVTFYYNVSSGDNCIQLLIPLRLTKGSYYDELDGFNLISSQILPTDSSDNLINFTSNQNTYTFIGMLSN
ncbi:MAG: hypothetical protein EBU90_27650 [Proteobacteria bacterium]|nr:hypothetical protein [Pseudomonadota bacterium]